MEDMEHVGNSWETMYHDKLTFLKEVSELINNKGFIVLSVPKMVGISFFYQIFGQRIFNFGNKKDILDLSYKDLIKCVLLCILITLNVCGSRYNSHGIQSQKV